MKRHIHRFRSIIFYELYRKFKLSTLTLVLLHQVSQTYMVAPLDLQFSILYDVLKKHVAEDAEYKVSYLSM
jgi:hypothetical protein